MSNGSGRALPVYAAPTRGWLGCSSALGCRTKATTYCRECDAYFCDAHQIGLHLKKNPAHQHHCKELEGESFKVVRIRDMLTAQHSTAGSFDLTPPPPPAPRHVKPTKQDKGRREEDDFVDPDSRSEERVWKLIDKRSKQIYSGQALDGDFLLLRMQDDKITILPQVESIIVRPWEDRDISTEMIEKMEKDASFRKKIGKSRVKTEAGNDEREEGEEKDNSLERSDRMEGGEAHAGEYEDEVDMDLQNQYFQDDEDDEGTFTGITFDTENDPRVETAEQKRTRLMLEKREREEERIRRAEEDEDVSDAGSEESDEESSESEQEEEEEEGEPSKKRKRAKFEALDEADKGRAPEKKMRMSDVGISEQDVHQFLLREMQETDMKNIKTLPKEVLKSLTTWAKKKLKETALQEGNMVKVKSHDHSLRTIHQRKPGTCATCKVDLGDKLKICCSQDCPYMLCRNCAIKLLCKDYVFVHILKYLPNPKKKG